MGVTELPNWKRGGRLVWPGPTDRDSVTGWGRLRELLLAPVDSVASLVAPLSGQNLVSVRDLYKRNSDEVRSVV